MDAYIHRNDIAHVVLSEVNHDSEVLVKTPLKSLKDDPRKIDTCFSSKMELRANLTCKQVSKMMGYYALHGQLDKIKKLINRGFVMPGKACINLLCRSDFPKKIKGFLKKHFDFRQFTVEINTDAWSSIKLDLIECKGIWRHRAEIVAARYGNLDALKYLRKKKFAMTSHWIATAAYMGGHRHVIDWLSQKFSNDGNMENNVSAMFYAGDLTLIEPHLWCDDNVVDFVLLCKIPEKRENMLGLIFQNLRHLSFSNYTSSLAARCGNVKLLALMRKCRKLTEIYEIYAYAAKYSQLKVMKWFNAVVPSAINLVMMSRVLSCVGNTVRTANLRTLKWIKKYAIESEFIDSFRMYFQSRKYDSTEIVEWAYEQQIIEKIDVFVYFIGRGNVKLAEKYKVQPDKSQMLYVENAIFKADNNRMFRWMKRNNMVGKMARIHDCTSMEIVKNYTSNMTKDIFEENARLAVQSGNINMLKFIICNNIDVRKLYFGACYYGHMFVIQWLVQYRPMKFVNDISGGDPRAIRKYMKKNRLIAYGAVW